MLLLGKKCLAERLAQKREDAVIDQEQVEGCVISEGKRGEGERK